MHLPSGIPTIADLDALKQTEIYRRHVQFNGAFLRRHRPAMAKYGRHWGLDPFKLWSRRWEYPFVAQRMIEFGQSRPGPVKILDAGSGVTYFPYFIIENLPAAEFICCDYDSSYSQMFADINAARGEPKVSFLEAALQKIPLDTNSLDAICCISVLEHTDNYEQIVQEFARVLRPGGMLVLTFDLSLDGKFTLPRPAAENLLRVIGEQFVFTSGFDPQRQLDRMNEPGILETDYVRRTEPQYLPWSMPVRVYKAAMDLLAGRGWTGGFRWRTIFCTDVVSQKA